MTVHTISSHTLNGSEIWGPYTAPDDTAWIKVWINTPPHSDPTYRRMFLDDVPIVIERRLSGSSDPWEHYGSHTIVGGTLQDANRDGFDPAGFWVSITADGYEYRVNVTTTYSQTITGSVDFDTVSTRLNLTTGGGIEITDFAVCVVYGPGGHGSGPRKRFTTPMLDVGSDNPGIIVVNPEQLPLYLPGACEDPFYPNASTGDFKKAFWGLNGTEIPRVSRAGRACLISAPIYAITGIKNDRDYVHVEYEDVYPEGWIDEGTPPEEREYAYVAQFACAVLVVKNIDQIDPVFDTWEAFATNAAADPNPVDYDGNPVGFSTTKTTVPGQLIVNSGIILTVVADSDPYSEPLSGNTAIFDHYTAWQQDEWSFGASYRLASGTSTPVGHYVGMTPGASNSAIDTAGSAIFSETKYVHLVVVETPVDENDLPDDDQIRSGNDGFDGPALYYKKRGPDADGTVRFDPTSIPGLAELTAVTFCAVYDDGTVPIYFNQTTAQAIHCVAVEDPGSPANYPNSDQIKAGTDYLDAAAPYVKKLTLPSIDGTEDLGSSSALDPDTDYLFAFVTGDEAPVYMQASTLGAALLEAFGTTQTQESETVGLIQASTLAAVGTSQDQTSQNSDLAQANTLTAQNTTQSQTSQNSGLTVAGQLGVQDTSQTQASQNSDLIIQYSLSVNNTTQSQTSGEVSLELSDALVVPATTQAQTSEQISLVQSNILQTGNTSQTQSSQNSLLGDRIPGALIAGQIRIIPAIGSLQIRTQPTLSSSPRILGPN